MASYNTNAGMTVTKLNESNYRSWKYNMSMLLKHHGIWGHATGEEVSSPTDSEGVRNKFKRENEKALSIIALAVEETQQIHIMECKTPKEAWDTLAGIFEPKSLPRILMLRRQFVKMELKTEESMNTYLSRIKKCADELHDAGDAISDKEIAYMMLSGLPDSYNGIVMALGNIDESKFSAKEIQKALMIEYERRNNKEEDKISETLVVSANKDKRREKTQKPGACYNCGRIGHFARQCRDKWHEKNAKGRSSNKKQANSLLLSFDTGQIDKNIWILDSGATHHVCNDKDQFVELRTTTKTINTAVNKENDEKKTVACGQGTVKVEMITSDGNIDITLNDVYYVPELRKNLISVAQAEENGKKVIFNNAKAYIIDKKRKEVILEADRRDGLYVVKHKNMRYQVHMNQTDVTSTGLWHERFCHANKRAIMELKIKQMVRGSELIKTDDDICKHCQIGKHTQAPSRSIKEDRNTKMLDLVHSDVCGPMQVRSNGGNRYMITFIDDSTNHTSVMFLKKKSDVTKSVIQYITRIERETGKKLKRFRSDNGLEYCNDQLNNYFRQAGIKHERTNTYSPSMNGKAERLNRTILDATRATLESSGLPKQFWAEIINTVVYLHNRLPHAANKEEVPQAKWSGYNPSIKHLKVYGCLAYRHITYTGRKKLDPRGRECIMVGYANATRGYRLWDPKEKKVIETKHVIFDESIKGHEAIYGTTETYEKNDNEFSVKIQNRDEEKVEDESEEDDTNSQIVGEIPRKPGRPPKVYKAGQFGSEGRVGQRINAKEEQIRNDNIEINNTEIIEPETYNEAISSPQADKWEEAMRNELQIMEKQKVWELVDIPNGVEILGSKWVFKIKRNNQGQTERYRARLVAKGFAQKNEIDFEQTYSPIANFLIFRILLVFSQLVGWTTRHIDVKCAYLNGKLNDAVYMHIPEGFANETPGKAVKLLKAIYGLKQSGRIWNETLDSLLIKHKFKRLLSSACVYINEDNVILVVYVDDIVLFSKNESSIEKVVKLLDDEYDIKDLGRTSLLLGIQIEYQGDNLIMHQETYIKQILERFNMEECRNIETPMDSNIKMTKEDCPKTKEEREEMSKVPYRQLIGALLYLALNTRPDILFSVIRLSQYNANPGKSHWQSAKRILRYIASTKGFGINCKMKDDKLRLFSDSDWAANTDNRRSISGYVVTIGDVPIMWRTSIQKSICSSTMEAEYTAVCSTVKEAMWLKMFLTELNLNEMFPTPYKILCDNRAAIAFGKNRIDRIRTKHIDIALHITREQHENGTIELSFVPSKLNLADILTKSLKKDLHKIGTERLCLDKF